MLREYPRQRLGVFFLPLKAALCMQNVHFNKKNLEWCTKCVHICNVKQTNNKNSTAMKTYTTSQNAPFNYTVDYAYSISAGHGHMKITAYIVDESGAIKEFSSLTNNMRDYDAAAELEGQEKYEALFELVQNDLGGEISEWLLERHNESICGDK